MDFEWDETKRQSNIKEHHLDFPRILSLFGDPAAVAFPDKRYNYGEERIILLCEKDGVLFQAVYTIREQKTRIISARRANKRERKRYDQAHKERNHH